MTDTRTMTPFDQAERELRLRGIILRQGAGTYQVERGGYQGEFERLEEAYEAGMALPALAAPSGPRKRPMSMRPRARIRRAIKAHNRRLRWAGRGKMI